MTAEDILLDKIKSAKEEMAASEFIHGVGVHWREEESRIKIRAWEEILSVLTGDRDEH